MFLGDHNTLSARVDKVATRVVAIFAHGHALVRGLVVKVTQRTAEHDGQVAEKHGRRRALGAVGFKNRARGRGTPHHRTDFRDVAAHEQSGRLGRQGNAATLLVIHTRLEQLDVAKSDLFPVGEEEDPCGDLAWQDVTVPHIHGFDRTVAEVFVRDPFLVQTPRGVTLNLSW